MSECAKTVITGLMPVVIVVVFEPIQIQHRQRQRLRRAGSALPFTCQCVIKTATVCNSGQSVAGAQCFESQVGLLQLGRTFLYPLLQRFVQYPQGCLFALKHLVKRGILFDRLSQLMRHVVQGIGKKMQLMPGTILEDKNPLTQVVDVELPHEIAQLGERRPEPALHDKQENEPKDHCFKDSAERDQKKAELNLMDDDTLV